MTIKNLEKNFVSAIIYVRNHEQSVESFFRGLYQTLTENFEKFEIIFVNDVSTDRSITIIKETTRELNGANISIINLSYYHGLEAAMIAGIDLAIGDFIYEFDSTWVDYDYDEVINVYRHCLKGFDVVNASPDVKERLTSKVFYSIFNKYSKNKVHLITERFRILSRWGINRINRLSTTIPYRKAIYFNCGLKTANLTYKSLFSLPQAQSGDNRQDQIELAVNSLLLFTNVGSRFATSLAWLMFLVSLFMIGYTVYVYLFYKHVVEGWTTMMLFISVSFTFMFALLAILIKYVAMILFLQHTKQTYVYESIEKLNN